MNNILGYGTSVFVYHYLALYFSVQHPNIWSSAIQFGSEKKITNAKKISVVKKQSSLHEESKLEADYSKKHKELKKPKREGSLDKYSNVKQPKRDASTDKYNAKKCGSDKTIYKVDEKKNERSKTKEKEQNVKVSTKEKLPVSKSIPDTTKQKDKARRSLSQIQRTLDTPTKKRDDSKSTTKLRSQPNKNSKTSSTPTKSNESERSRTATLSRGGDKTSSKSRKPRDKKDDRSYDKQRGDKYAQKYDPRKKERELEKKANESLEKIYNFNSSKSRTPSKSSVRTSNSRHRKEGNRKKHEERDDAKHDDNFDSLSQIDTNEFESLSETPTTLPQMEIEHNDLYSVAAGDHFIGEATNKTDDKENENEYEDDFESYESDFEECTESGVSEDEDLSITDEADDDLDSDSSDAQEKPTVEEERKLDSGNYDLATQKQRRHLSEIKDAMVKENSLCNARDGSRSESHIPNEETTLQPGKEKFFINFANARQRQKKEKVKAAIQNRGDRLLEMIRLDAMGFSVLDLPAVPYEIYIQCYGKSNSIQMHTQTNEESLSEEVQTEDVKVCSKWTQHPVAFCTSTSDSQDLLQIFAKERIGVGGDGIETVNEDWNFHSHSTSLRLHNFLSAAAEVMLVLLEEEQLTNKIKHKSVLSNKSKNLGFSQGHNPLLVDNVTFLKGRCITHINFSVTSKNQLVTVHKASEKMAVLKQEPRSLKEESLGRCMLCIWSICEPSMPQKILVSPDEVSSVSFFDNFVIAGLIDGSVSLWDLREKSAWHQRTGINGIDWTLYSPTFITAKILSDSSHGSPVVSIQCLNSRTTGSDTEPTSISQIATLEEEGSIIIWTVVDLLKFHQQDYSIQSTVPGLAPWGRVRLVCSSTINVSKYFERSLDTKIQFTVMAINNNHIYVGTNVGLVAHCLQPNGKAQPLIYKAKSGESSHVNSIEISPYGQPMFMVGTSGGRVKLFLNRSEFPLVDVCGTVANPGPAVVSLQWSPHRPGMFFVLDENSSLHIWDLCNSDIFPMFSVPMNDAKLSSLQISPHSETSLLAIGTELGAVELHKLTSELGQQSRAARRKEMEIFTHYINIL